MKRIVLWSLFLVVLLTCLTILKFRLFENDISKVSQGTPIEKYDENKSAMLVIDIQEGTTGRVSRVNNYKNGSDELIKKINHLIQTAHDKDLQIIYIRNEVSDWFINMIDNSMQKGTEGALLDNRLLRVNDQVIQKERQDAFSNLMLDSILIKNKISKLYVTGLDAAFCINNTIEAATSRKYKVVVVSDAIISETDSLKNLMMEKYAGKNVELIDSEEFIAAFSGL